MINVLIFYLWSCHLIWGQGDDTLYPGVTDLLYPAAHNQLNSLKNHNSVAHYQLEEKEEEEEKKREEKEDKMEDELMAQHLLICIKKSANAN